MSSPASAAAVPAHRPSRDAVPVRAPGERRPRRAALTALTVDGHRGETRTPYGAFPHQYQEQRPEGFLADPDLPADSQPDRRPAAVLRALPADEAAPRGAREPRPAVGVHQHLSVLRLPRDLLSRLREVLDRRLAVQVRRAQ